MGGKSRQHHLGRKKRWKIWQYEKFARFNEHGQSHCGRDEWRWVMWWTWGRGWATFKTLALVIMVHQILERDVVSVDINIAMNWATTRDGDGYAPIFDTRGERWAPHTTWLFFAGGTGAQSVRKNTTTTQSPCATENGLVRYSTMWSW